MKPVLEAIPRGNKDLTERKKLSPQVLSTLAQHQVMESHNILFVYSLLVYLFSGKGSPVISAHYLEAKVFKQ